MSDSFTETTSRSWFSRIGGALSGVVIGLILILVSIVALFWNEGRSVKTARALAEGAGLVETIDPAGGLETANGRLVHFSGQLKPEGIAADNLFSGVAAPAGSTALIRNVEMYQWEETSRSETRTKLGGGEETVTTYTYSKVWADRAIDSGSFKRPAGHENPPMPVRGETFSVPRGTVGSITLDGEAIDNIGEMRPVAPGGAVADAVKAAFGSDRFVTPDGEAVAVRAYPGTTTVGDLRISFQSRHVDDVSAVGQLKSGRLGGYKASNGQEIFMVQAGQASAKEMFDSAVAENTVITWIIRLAGFIFMAIGFGLVLAVIGVIGDVVPLIGSILRFATGFVAFAAASLVSTIVIAVAWFYYRPLLSVAIVAAGLLLSWLSLRFGKARAAAKAPETAGKTA